MGKGGVFTAGGVLVFHDPGKLRTREVDLQSAPVCKRKVSSGAKK